MSKCISVKGQSVVLFKTGYFLRHWLACIASWGPGPTEERESGKRENVSYEGLCGGASTFANQAFCFLFLLGPAGVGGRGGVGVGGGGGGIRGGECGEMMRRASTIRKSRLTAHACIKKVP